jgi:hypothetical protein
MSRVRWVPLVVLAVAVFALGGRLPAAEKHTFVSGWRGGEIRVDAVDEEWRPLLQPVKGQRISIAFLNDDEALYFCLVTTDENAITQIGLMGLTVWLDAADGAKKRFGVHYPSRSGPRPNPRRPPTPAGDEPAGPVAAPADPWVPAVDVLGPGKKDATRVENGPVGVVARMAGRPDLLVYEMKVALRRGEAVAFAPDVDAGAAMRVELQTPEWRGPLPPAGLGGRTRIGVGVGGPSGGVVYPGPNTTLLKPLSVTGSLRLAAAPGR